MLLGLSAAGPTAAVDPIIGVPLPDEPPSRLLDDQGVTAAVPFDLDGDGVRELVTVGAREDAGGLAGVRAWWVAEDGSVEASNQVRVRRSASVDELLAGRGRLGIDRDDMIAVQLDEAAKLVVAERDGKDTLLLVTLGTPSEAVGVPCCVTVWQVVMDGPRSVELRLAAETMRSGNELAIADFDGDGTDELLVIEIPFDATAETQVDASVLTWRGDGFERDGFTLPVGICCPGILDVGETDGLPGEEVLLAVPILAAPFDGSAHLLRITVRRGVPHTEVGPEAQAFRGRIVELESGPAIAIGDSDLVLWTWPSGREAAVQATRTTGGAPVAIFGRGATARILVAAGRPPGTVLALRGDLGVDTVAPFVGGPITTIGRDVRAGIFAGSSFESEPPPPPYFGLLPRGPGELDDSYVFAGTRVIASDDPDVLATALEMALLPGLEPVGRVGPDGAWMALLNQFADAGDVPTDRRVGLFDFRAPGILTLAFADAVLEPEEGSGHLAPTFYGMAPDPEHLGSLLVGNEAAEAEITAPPGTVLSLTSSMRPEVTVAEAGPDGVARINLLPPAGPDAPDGSGATVTLRAVTPSGHAYVGTWRIRVFRQPPDLGISEDPALVDFAPTIAGRTAPGSTVMINNAPVAVAADGSFDAPVDVGIVPTELRVVVTDPVGNRTERVITRVWPVDYRRLPFIPIAVLLTVAAGAILFLRKPDARPGRGRPDDGATFEEIGG